MCTELQTVRDTERIRFESPGDFDYASRFPEIRARWGFLWKAETRLLMTALGAIKAREQELIAAAMKLRLASAGLRLTNYETAVMCFIETEKQKLKQIEERIFKVLERSRFPRREKRRHRRKRRRRRMDRV